MQNIDLPTYLKNSRILNNLSIRRLLQNWAIICSAAVILLSITALVTNDIISSKQEILDGKLVPVSNIIRNLEYLLDENKTRRQAILETTRIEELRKYLSEDDYDQVIAGYLSGLTQQTAGFAGLQTMLPGLLEKFRHYLALDLELVGCMTSVLATAAMADLQGSCSADDVSRIVAALTASDNELAATLQRISSLTAENINTLTSLSRDLSFINLAIVMVVSLLVIAIIVAGTSLVIYRIDEPLNRVRVAMHDLSAGDMSRRLEENREVRDEFAELTMDFNRSAGRLESLFNEVIDANSALDRNEKRTRAILENALVGIAHVKDKKIIAVNRKFEDIFGYARNEIEGKDKDILYPSARVYDAINEAAGTLLANGETYQGEWKMKHKNGNIFWCAVSAKSISETTGAEGIIWLFEDITQRKRSEDELLHLTNYDTLTGLPNRSLFMDRLQQGMSRSVRQQMLLGLLYIDLDRFKKINDSLGHSAGDELLKSAAGRIMQCVRTTDTVCRLGGDEFTVILPEIQDISVAGKVAEKIISLMETPFDISGEEISISPSIGVSIFPDDAGDIESLVKNADSAMYHAKSKGRNNYQYYTQTMNAEARTRLDRENRLRRAVEYDQFMLYYQPQVDVQSLRVTGYEALIRWHDSEDGLVSPDQFIPLLEDTGLIVPVGDWILRRACRDIAEMARMNPDFRSVSINLSARQFVDNTIVDRIKLIMDEAGVTPEQLVIEITETIMMTETARSLEILNQMSGLGLKLSLDDFGTGYSSLAYLKQFPINVIKIDKSFVHDLHKNQGDAAICEAIIAIARQLGLKVVAEGVETADQFNFMQAKSCNAIQGYYFGKPQPLGQLLCKVA